MNASSPAEPGNAERAADRRLWLVQKGTLQELEADDADLSASTTVEERWAMMWQLAKDAWAFRGVTIGEPPFPRHPVRIIRGRG